MCAKQYFILQYDVVGVIVRFRETREIISSIVNKRSIYFFEAR